MKALEIILGKKPGALNPVGFCSCAFAVLRTRRYSFSRTPRFNWWVDVCYFKKDDLYVVGTIESQLKPGEPEANLHHSQERSMIFKAGFQVECPVPSKIVAYLTKHYPQVILPIPSNECLSPASMFTKRDPFGGGNFSPVVYADDSDEDGEED
jgi:hypothetical protein